jgi:phasin family protein
MSAIPEQLLARQKEAVNHYVAAQNAMFSGFEKLVDLNVKVLRATLDEFNQHAQQSSATRDTQEALVYASSAFQPGIEKAFAYSKHAYSIFSGMQGELARLQEAQVSASHEQVIQLVDQLAKNAPAGSESAIAALKSSLSTANGAYESLSKAAKQAAQVAESNLNAATNASFKAAVDGPDAAARARRTA